ncbi:Hydrogenase maturation factor [Halanaeroarchaeum sp. HSR-CO]|uniref:carbamoyltransferase HypF n=1 Tax=Halanaeroarchaeum sp. HSR-CO TaxID=2866382 RepID=UPI00217E0763|nr:carbamoyltransferase HypF [Halanaeroarchaeum sp. HSR-CO]UWG47166.1 Hydrogenase maturation factor [Halanaeroarchaeum sp. HSR-CO]
MGTEPRRTRLTVTGVVQGVGFRPFVYRTATDHGLAGWVKNRGDAGVAIVVEGQPDAIAEFVRTVREEPPPLARVESIDREPEPPVGLDSFEIRESAGGGEGSGTIPADTGICESCLEDMRDPDSRYCEYWATACVDCGPRYTVIRSLPYDRPRTTMDAFPLCTDCRRDYEDPSDRRYHAQTTACPACGPTLTFESGPGVQEESGRAAIDRTTTTIEDGGIVAVKGIGGTHLLCDATNRNAVARLRERTGRPAKPFALMAPSIDRVEAFARVTDQEREAFEDVRRPIVLLKRKSAEWLEPIAPNLHTVGVMGPYAGLHHLLFDDLDAPLVATSANPPGQPMATDRETIWATLSDVIDGALVHDREIVARTDDSVVRMVDGKRRFVRRSRGWVPQRLPRYADPAPSPAPDVLAMGAEFDATVAVTQGSAVVPSQHLGDVDGPATRRFHRETVDHLTELLGVTPSIVACDAHPEFVTSREAERRADAALAGPIRVQHHHAHAASLLGEHERHRAIVIVADGTGYGPDGSIWGGEVLDATRRDFERVGSLAPFALPGGEAAVRRPVRILASLLEDDDRIDSLLEAGLGDAADAAVVRDQLGAAVNAPRTTSAGRFLDATCAMLEPSVERRYEGEPAMRLEALASEGAPIDVPIPIEDGDDRPVLDVRSLARELGERRDGHPPADVAATAQHALARGLGRLAVAAATERGVDAVGFSGGVAYNEAISRTVASTVEDAGLQLLDHEDVPPGDAGIAYGQTIVATARTDATEGS